MSSKTPNLGAFASLAKPGAMKPKPAAQEGKAQEPKIPRTKAKAGSVGGTRKITVRDLTDEDLRRLGEFRYTHKLSIQQLAIEGLSRALMARGLPPLTGYIDPDASGGETE